MKQRYEEEFARKETLDQKANNMMTISGTVVTLYSGFGIATTTNLFTKGLALTSPTITLLIGVVLLITALFFGIRAYMLKEYEHAFNFKDFITEIKDDMTLPSKKKILFDDKKLEEYEKKDHTIFNKLMIKIYTRCIVFNNITNEKRAGFVFWSQKLFLIGLFTFPIFILVSIVVEYLSHLPLPTV